MASGADTIFGMATGAGRAGIAILRVSGDAACTILTAMVGAIPSPRHAVLRRVRAQDGATIDHALVLWFPGPGSYTGEDVFELHLHAGPAVIDAALEAVAMFGARPAQPGEFTRRAFLSGRIDLVEAEGIGDLIDAETQDQRRLALAHANGGLSRIFDDWASRLLRLVALQEAAIDFPDETGNDALEASIDAETTALEAEFDAQIEQSRGAERARRGLVVCVSGAPNVGKSSLINRLAERDISIVSALPGTTRDVIETRIIVAGVLVTLVDTAGLRLATDEIEAEGIERAHRAMAAADLVLCVGTPACAPTGPADRTMLISNKIDLAPAASGTIGVSALTGEGMDILRSTMAARVRALAGIGGSPAMSHARHRDCVLQARDHLRLARRSTYVELRGEELRLALQSLGRLTGKVDVEDVLDAIFSSFCIGK